MSELRANTPETTSDNADIFSVDWNSIEDVDNYIASLPEDIQAELALATVQKEKSLSEEANITLKKWLEREENEQLEQQMAFKQYLESLDSKSFASSLGYEITDYLSFALRRRTVSAGQGERETVNTSKYEGSTAFYLTYQNKLEKGITTPGAIASLYADIIEQSRVKTEAPYLSASEAAERCMVYGVDLLDIAKKIRQFEIELAQLRTLIYSEKTKHGQRRANAAYTLRQLELYGEQPYATPQISSGEGSPEWLDGFIHYLHEGTNATEFLQALKNNGVSGNSALLRLSRDSIVGNMFRRYLDTQELLESEGYVYGSAKRLEEYLGVAQTKLSNEDFAEVFLATIDHIPSEQMQSALLQGVLIWLEQQNLKKAELEPAADTADTQPTDKRTFVYNDKTTKLIQIFRKVYLIESKHQEPNQANLKHLQIILAKITG